MVVRTPLRSSRTAPCCILCSTSVQQAWLAQPPSFRVESPPQIEPHSRQLSRGDPLSQRWRNPALKESPAPVVSTTCTSIAEAVYSRPLTIAAAPLFPNFATTIDGPVLM